MAHHTKKSPRRLSSGRGLTKIPLDYFRPGLASLSATAREWTIENKRENSAPRLSEFGEAITSRFRLGATILPLNARFVLDLTSNGRRKFCQAKTAHFEDIFAYRTPYSWEPRLRWRNRPHTDPNTLGCAILQPGELGLWTYIGQISNGQFDFHLPAGNSTAKNSQA